MVHTSAADAASSLAQGVERPADLALRLTGLHKSFGDVRAVDGVDLAVPGGETLALLGPNGAGKSTTVDLVLGLTTPDAGEVAVYGRPPGEAIATGLIGAMLQSGGMPPDVRVADLLSVVASLHKHPMPMPEVLARAGATALPKKKVAQLSGGELQRVRLALALLPDPRLLVLDEPTAAMDVASRRAFWSDMTEWVADGRTLIFTTHHLDEADAFADRVVLLRSGRVVADGTSADVKSLVGLRHLRARVPGVRETELAALPGVSTVSLSGDLVALGCTDSDAALKALLAAHPDATDLEIGGAALEDAFLALTTEDPS